MDDGVVINGLPIINDHPRFGGPPNGAELVPYYRDSVAGGPGHFVIVAEGFATFADAIRRKLIQEISLQRPIELDRRKAVTGVGAHRGQEAS